MKFLLLLILFATVLLASAQYGPSNANPWYCVIGEYSVVRNDNRNYWKCENNRWTLKTCPRGTVFDKNRYLCFVDRSQPPPPPPRPPTSIICPTGSTRGDIFDNSKFEFCQGGYQWVAHYCKPGQIYDPRSHDFCSWVPAKPTTTTTTTTTTRAPEKWCKAGSYKADPEDCRAYYQCDNGHWRSMPCGGGTGWDQLNLVCNHIELVCTGDFKPKSGNAPPPPPNNNGF